MDHISYGPEKWSRCKDETANQAPDFQNDRKTFGTGDLMMKLDL